MNQASLRRQYMKLFKRRLGAPNAFVGGSAIGAQFERANAGSEVASEAYEAALQELEPGQREHIAAQGCTVLLAMQQEYGLVLRERVKSGQRRIEALAQRTYAEEGVAAVLRRVAAEIQDAIDSPDLLERMCRMAVDALRCDWAHILLRWLDTDTYAPVAGCDATGTRIFDEVQRIPRSALLGVGAVGQPERPVRLVTLPSANGCKCELPGAVPGSTLVLYLPLCLGPVEIGILAVGCRERVEPFDPLEECIAAGLSPLFSLAVAHHERVGRMTAREKGASLSDRRRWSDGRGPSPRREQQPAGHRVTASTRSSGRRPCILVIDDDPAVRRAFELALEDFPCDVIVSSGGVEGLVQLNTRDVDLVFVDLKMPVMDGIDTLQRMRAVGCDVPVRIATGYAGEFEPRLQALTADGFDLELLHKPLGSEAIRRAANAALSLH